METYEHSYYTSEEANVKDPYVDWYMTKQVDTAMIHAAVAAASAAREKAYAPYSSFFVGAALVDADGNIHVGCNVENASYGLTNCAEWAAAAAATVAGRRDIVLCVVVTDTEEPVAPCGACRQVLSECNPDMPIVCATLSGIQKMHNLAALLPQAFGPESLRKLSENS